MRFDGAVGRENAGISSKTGDEKSPRRKSKVSSATRIVGRLGGPKANPNGLTDGQLVNIPTLPCFFNGMTEFISLSASLDSRCWFLNA